MVALKACIAVVVVAMEANGAKKAESEAGSAHSEPLHDSDSELTSTAASSASSGGLPAREFLARENLEVLANDLTFRNLEAGLSKLDPEDSASRVYRSVWEFAESVAHDDIAEEECAKHEKLMAFLVPLLEERWLENFLEDWFGKLGERPTRRAEFMKLDKVKSDAQTSSPRAEQAVRERWTTRAVEDAKWTHAVEDADITEVCTKMSEVLAAAEERGGRSTPPPASGEDPRALRAFLPVLAAMGHRINDELIAIDNYIFHHSEIFEDSPGITAKADAVPQPALADNDARAALANGVVQPAPADEWQVVELDGASSDGWENIEAPEEEHQKDAPEEKHEEAPEKMLPEHFFIGDDPDLHRNHLPRGSDEPISPGAASSEGSDDWYQSNGSGQIRPEQPAFAESM